MIRTRNRELWLAFITIVLVSILYTSLVIAWRRIPPARELFGHSLGILGFVLMLTTETLYSIRKRTRRARWGRMSAWLEFHIFTGLVGPFLVLLHTSWKFNGLAGVVILLTLIVVLSGFFGRYIYTAIPRTADGVELAESVLAQEFNQAQQEFDSLLSAQPAALQALLVNLTKTDLNGSSFIIGRAFSDLKERIAWWWATRKLDADLRQQARHLQRLAFARRRLRAQLASLAFARRILAIWHAVHIPIGMALFTTAFIHILAAIYYATLLC